MSSHVSRTPPRSTAAVATCEASPLSLYLMLPEAMSPEAGGMAPTPSTEGQGGVVDERLAQRVNLTVGGVPSKHVKGGNMRLNYNFKKGPTTRGSPAKGSARLQEVNEAAEAIYEMSHPDANIIFGAQIDETMGSVLSITVVATGFRD